MSTLPTAGFPEADFDRKCSILIGRTVGCQFSGLYRTWAASFETAQPKYNNELSLQSRKVQTRHLRRMALSIDLRG